MSERVPPHIALKPMSEAPTEPLWVEHYEKGLMRVSPNHDANWWLAFKQPGVKHWYRTDDEESGCFDDLDFDGWYAIQTARRCDENVCEARMGECVACGAANGEACRQPLPQSPEETP